MSVNWNVTKNVIYVIPVKSWFDNNRVPTYINLELVINIQLGNKKLLFLFTSKYCSTLSINIAVNGYIFDART